MTVYLVIERDYDGDVIRAVYADAVPAGQHAAELGLAVEEHVVSEAYRPDPREIAAYQAGLRAAAERRAAEVAALKERTAFYERMRASAPPAEANRRACPGHGDSLRLTNGFCIYCHGWDLRPEALASARG